MPYTGASLDWLISCLCCGKACIEIKCPYSMNYTESNEQNHDYLYEDGDIVKSKQNHKYFTQCPMQVGVTKTLTLWFGLHMEW